MWLDTAFTEQMAQALLVAEMRTDLPPEAKSPADESMVADGSPEPQAAERSQSMDIKAEPAADKGRGSGRTSVDDAGVCSRSDPAHAAAKSATFYQ